MIHRFRFTPSYRTAALPFTVTPSRAWVEVTEAELRVRLGPWRLRTPRENIRETTLTGGYAFLKTAGPAHLSFADHGVTFATNPDQGLCICFHEPVRTLDPRGRLRHPGATMTVTDPVALQRELGI